MSEVSIREIMESVSEARYNDGLNVSDGDVSSINDYYFSGNDDLTIPFWGNSKYERSIR